MCMLQAQGQEAAGTIIQLGHLLVSVLVEPAQIWEAVVEACTVA